MSAMSSSRSVDTLTGGEPSDEIPVFPCRLSAVTHPMAYAARAKGRRRTEAGLRAVYQVT